MAAFAASSGAIMHGGAQLGGLGGVLARMRFGVVISSQWLRAHGAQLRSREQKRRRRAAGPAKSAAKSQSLVRLAHSLLLQLPNSVAPDTPRLARRNDTLPRRRSQ